MIIKTVHMTEYNKKKRRFFANALVLSCVSILMRGISVGFNAYINNKIGAEGMGLFTLVMSVYGFAVTLALSCVNLGAMKLTSERCVQLSECDKTSWRKSILSLVMKLCMYALFFGTLSALLMYFTSSPAAKYLLSDLRTEKPLKILALSLPAISLSSALSGFFTGLRKVYKNAISSLNEQFVRIILISTGLYLVGRSGVENSCLALVAGSALSEVCSLAVNLVMYIADSKKPSGEKYGTRQAYVPTKIKNVTDISFVAAVGAYARQGLNTLEHLAIPAGLKKSGLRVSEALAAYGLLQGIAFPLVMFPYAVIGSFTSLLIPEIAEKHELGNTEEIKSLTEEVYKYSAVFSVGACGIFVLFGKSLGGMIYGSTEAAMYTVVLGFLVPFMYLDTAVDSLLKGMGEQVYNMKVNIIDSAAGLVLVMLLTPRLGVWGYILTVWVCEVGNLAASIHKLGKITGVGVRSAANQYFKPCIAILLSAVLKVIVLDRIIQSQVVGITAFAVLYLAIVSVIKKIKACQHEIM